MSWILQRCWNVFFSGRKLQWTKHVARKFFIEECNKQIHLQSTLNLEEPSQTNWCKHQPEPSICNEPGHQLYEVKFHLCPNLFFNMQGERETVPSLIRATKSSVWPHGSSDIFKRHEYKRQLLSTGCICNWMPQSIFSVSVNINKDMKG